MPDVQECQKWIEGSKKILGRSDAKKMSQRNAEIALLLKDKDIVGSNVFNDFKGKYDDLATRAFNIGQGASGKNAKRDLGEVASELRLLKKRIRLAAAEKDPTTTKKVEAELLSSTKREPYYRDKRERLLQAEKTIEGMPGAQKNAAAIQSMLDEAESYEPDFEKAFSKLGGEPSALVEAAKKESAKFVQTAGDDKFKEALAKARETVKAYETVAGISDGRTVAEENGKIEAAIRLLEGDKPDEKTAKAELQGVIQRLEAKAGKLTKIQEGLDDKIGDITETVQNIMVYAPVEAAVEIRAKHQTARALWENQQFELAKPAWDELETAADKALKQYEPAYKKWQGYSKKIDEKKKVLDEAVKEAAFSGMANYLGSLISHQIGVEMIPLHKFDEACKLVEKEGIIDGLDELQAQIKNPANAKFKNPEMDYRCRADKAGVKLTTALASISAQLKELEEKGGDTGPYLEAQATFRNDWAVGTAADDPKKVDPNFLLGAMLSSWENVKADLAKDLGGGLGASKDKKKKAVEAVEFEKARKAAEAALRELAEYNLPDKHRWMADNPDIVDLRAGYQSMVVSSAQGQYPVFSMQKIQSDCKNKAALIENDLKRVRDAALETANDLKKQIAEAEKKNSQYKVFYAALLDEIEECLGRTRSAVLSQVEAGAADLKKVTLPLPDDYKGVSAGLKEVETLVGQDDLKSYQPEAQKLLKKRFDEELKSRVNQLSPAEAVKVIKAFKVEVQGAVDRAGVLKTLRDEVKDGVKTAKQELEDIKEASSLYKSLSDRLSKISDPDKAVVDKANLELASIKILLKTAKSGQPARDKLDKKAQKDEFEGKRQDALYKGSLEVFTRGVKADAEKLYDKTPKGQRNEDIYKQISTLEGAAAKLAGNKNYAGANQELLRAANMARYFLANPLDQASASRNELGRLNQEYKAAVSTYLKQLSDLEAGLKTAEEDDGTGALKPVDTTGAVKAIQPLFGLFGAGIFDSSIEKLQVQASSLEELETRRSYKEIALKDLRILEKNLDSNQLLKHVVANTIAPVTVAPIRAALRGLTGALMAS